MERRSAGRQNEPEESGRWVVAILQRGTFMSFELWGFLEEKLEVVVDELSVFRDPDGKPTGCAVAMLAKEVSCKKGGYDKLKNIPIFVRVISSPAECSQFVRQHAMDGFTNPFASLMSTIPLLYVTGFDGDVKELEEIIGKDKLSASVERFVCPGLVYFVISLTSQDELNHIMSSLRALGVVMGGLYPRSRERVFAVHNCGDDMQLIEEVKRFGQIEEVKRGSDGTVYFMMDNTEQNGAACVLLNEATIGGTTISTHFVDWQEYIRARPQSIS